MTVRSTSLDAAFHHSAGTADPDLEIISAATGAVISLLGRTSLDVLGSGNPGYVGFDWTGYLRASQQRIWVLHKLLGRLLSGKVRILDQGSLLGNFTLALHRLGHDVTAADSYGAHGTSLKPWMTLLQDERIPVYDCDLATERLPFPDASFDCVIAMGVIEHIPHTPRMFLIELSRVLRPGGVLIIETPNLLYQAKRDALAAGQSIFQDIRGQFWCQPPFTGHHREYTPTELAWMLEQVGLECPDVYAFDYSCFAIADRGDSGWQRHYASIAAPDTQELIIGVGWKGPPCPVLAIGDPPPANALGPVGPLHGPVEIDFGCSGYQPGEATLTAETDHLRIQTTANQFLYAALSRTFPAISQAGSALVVDLDVIAGGCSVGILLLPKDEMVLSHAVRGTGRQKVVLPIPATAGTGTMRFVISNFSESVPRQSTVHIYAAAVARAAPPTTPGQATP